MGTQLSERKYWDIANALLVKCEAMSSLLLSMDRFYEQDMKRKIAAAQVISRYFKEKLKGRFQWPRFMLEHDKSEQFKYKEKSESRRKLVATQKHLLNMATQEL